MEQAISVTMTDVDLYENNITLFTNKFVSPLSSLGPSFYKYYLMDTLTVAGKPCVDLTFVPFNSESFGFTGHLYVMLDSTYFVKRAVMNFPQKINLYHLTTLFLSPYHCFFNPDNSVLFHPPCCGESLSPCAIAGTNRVPAHARNRASGSCRRKTATSGCRTCLHAMPNH